MINFYALLTGVIFTNAGPDFDFDIQEIVFSPNGWNAGKLRAHFRLPKLGGAVQHDPPRTAEKMSWMLHLLLHLQQDRHSLKLLPADCAE